MFAVIATYLWQTMVANKKVLADLGSVDVHWQASEFFLLVVVLTLLPINWLLESLKWQVIAANTNLSIGQTAN